jgi:hypothetical protein
MPEGDIPLTPSIQGSAIEALNRELDASIATKAV